MTFLHGRALLQLPSFFHTIYSFTFFSHSKRFFCGKNKILCFKNGLRFKHTYKKCQLLFQIFWIVFETKRFRRNIPTFKSCLLFSLIFCTVTSCIPLRNSTVSSFLVISVYIMNIYLRVNKAKHCIIALLNKYHVILNSSYQTKTILVHANTKWWILLILLFTTVYGMRIYFY